MGGSDLSWIPKPVKIQIPQWFLMKVPEFLCIFWADGFLKSEIPKTIGFNTKMVEHFRWFLGVSHHFGGSTPMWSLYTSWMVIIHFRGDWIYIHQQRLLAFLGWANNVNHPAATESNWIKEMAWPLFLDLINDRSCFTISKRAKLAGEFLEWKNTNGQHVSKRILDLFEGWNVLYQAFGWHSFTGTFTTIFDVSNFVLFEHVIWEISGRVKFQSQRDVTHKKPTRCNKATKRYPLVN